MLLTVVQLIVCMLFIIPDKSHVFWADVFPFPVWLLLSTELPLNASSVLIGLLSSELMPVEVAYVIQCARVSVRFRCSVAI